MSTWTSRAALAALLLAGACTAMGPTGPGPVRAMVGEGGVLIAPPQGFCADPGAARQDGPGAFLLFADCVILSREHGDGTASGAVLTASVRDGGLASGEDAALDALEGFLRSGQGRAMLGRGGSSAQVEVVETGRDGGVLYVRVRDAGAPDDGMDPAFWRAFFELEGRTVALSAMGAEGAGLDAAAGLALIRRFVATTRAANAGAAS